MNCPGHDSTCNSFLWPAQRPQRYFGCDRVQTQAVLSDVGVDGENNGGDDVEVVELSCFRHLSHAASRHSTARRALNPAEKRRV